MPRQRPPLLTTLGFASLALFTTIVACSPTTPTGPTTRNTSSNTNTSTNTNTTATILTPAREMAGTWQNDSAITFYYQTDFCGARRDVARALWNVVWEVRAVSGFSNAVDVEMRHTRGSMSILGSCNPTGWVPAVSPVDFRLCISGSSFSRCEGSTNRNGYAHGSFTSDLIMSTWTHWECIIYCSGERTEQNELKLSRRR
jgi:hypothetical protein